QVVHSIRSSIRTDDLIGRIGGDELVVLFPGCKKNIAQTRLGQARNFLIKFGNLAQRGPGAPFHFGLVENSELFYVDNDEYLDKMLGTAFKRMQQAKESNRSTADESDDKNKQFVRQLNISSLLSAGPNIVSRNKPMES
ncbi:MAG: GGDEF domain-containing protein, partial [Candidatus Adiutrix sp.]